MDLPDEMLEHVLRFVVMDSGHVRLVNRRFRVLYDSSRLGVRNCYAVFDSLAKITLALKRLRRYSTRLFCQRLVLVLRWHERSGPASAFEVAAFLSNPETEVMRARIPLVLKMDNIYSVERTALVSLSGVIQELTVQYCEPEIVLASLRVLQIETRLLTALDLVNSDLSSDSDVTVLVSALSKLPLLSRLNISGNQFSDHGVALLATAFSHLPLLSCLRITSSAINDSGVASLATALEAHTRLHTIDLSSNEFGNAGAAALGEHLARAPALTELDVSDIQSEDLIENNGSKTYSIFDAGIAALVSALSASPSMRVLYIDEFSVGDAGALAIAHFTSAGRVVHQV